MRDTYLQQLFVGKRQDALKDDHVGAVHGFLQAEMEGFPSHRSKLNYLVCMLGHERENHPKGQTLQGSLTPSSNIRMKHCSYAEK